MTDEKKVSIDIGNGKSIEISTGKLAKLANGSALVRQGETVVLAAIASAEPEEFSDFLPLQVDYREKYSAAGRFPGGYMKREGKPTDKEILTCRMTDRPIRPLFPEGFYDEIQVFTLLMSFDTVNEPDVLSILGASAALCLSDLPFLGPIGAARIACVDGTFIANPTKAEMQKSSIDLVYAGLPGKVVMIEGDADECSEELLRDAMLFADQIVIRQCEAQRKLAEMAGRPKKTPKLQLVPDEVAEKVRCLGEERIKSLCVIAEKEKRQVQLEELRKQIDEKVMPELSEKYPDLRKMIKLSFDKLVEKSVRNAILSRSVRIDGRGLDQIRPLSAEVGVLPRVHGSGLFTRGETQALVTVVLGAGSDAQDSEPVTGDVISKKFFLHYYFPNFSVNEPGRIGAPGRREIGHGNLAERSLAKVMPKDYPYTVRCVSEIMASNGSTSMASVCGGSIALMDAGVPIKEPVAGISCGLIYEDQKNVLLTDIIGAEDHFGDMDFKVCGTKAGITGFQLDLKVPGIPIDLLYQAMQRNKEARLKILDVMNACISAPREDISKYAPRIARIKINPEKIGAVIGPGGSVIRRITETTGAQIDIEDDGSVNIFASKLDALKAAEAEILCITAEVELNKTYEGTVVSIKDFGAFVEVLPGQEGLLHISEMDVRRVEKVRDICKEGDKIAVKVIDIDDKGKIRLSRKALLVEKGSSASAHSGAERQRAPSEEVQVGKIYRGTVVSIKDFGAFVEIVPGREGLLHISEMANYQVERVTDICKEGDKVSVKVLSIDERGKIRLSRKAALAEMGS